MLLLLWVNSMSAAVKPNLTARREPSSPSQTTGKVTSITKAKAKRRKDTAAESITARSGGAVLGEATISTLKPSRTKTLNEEPRSSASDRSLLSIQPTTLKPGWLRSLQGLEQASTVLSCLLVVGALVTYGWTVYSQQQWSQEYRQLEALRRSERQLTAANESLKNKLAQEAENPGTNLVAPQPEHLVFLSPAPVTTKPAQPSEPPSPLRSSELPESTPLGY